MSLEGRVAVVTGAAHGIGTAIADALATDGAKVHRVDKEPVALDGSAVTAADLTDPAAVGDYFSAVGPVDILVNTAGGVVGQVGRPLEEVPAEDWQAVLGGEPDDRVPVHPGGRARDEAARLGPDRHHLLGGRRSPSARPASRPTPAPRRASSASPGRWRTSSGPFGITVNCIAPGFILSNPTTQVQWDSYGPDGQQALVAGIATRRLGEPADIANGVQFFASERSGWVTGQVIAIDGGSAFQ